MSTALISVIVIVLIIVVFHKPDQKPSTLKFSETPPSDDVIQVKERIIKSHNRKRFNYQVAFIMGFLAWGIGSMIVYHFTLKGMMIGDENLSKALTFKARLNPDLVKYDILPFAIAMGSVLGIIVFIISLFLTRERSTY